MRVVRSCEPDTQGILIAAESTAPAACGGFTWRQKGMIMMKRCEAIASGVRNAVDTVVIDREMSSASAFRSLKGFIQDSLSSAKLSDTVTTTDLATARQLWPLPIE